MGPFFDRKIDAPYTISTIIRVRISSPGRDGALPPGSPNLAPIAFDETQDLDAYADGADA